MSKNSSNFGRITILVLLFVDLPSAVSLVAKGTYSLLPAAISLLGATSKSF